MTGYLERHRSRRNFDYVMDCIWSALIGFALGYLINNWR